MSELKLVEHLGLLSISVSWATIAYILVKWPLPPAASISEHAAARKGVHDWYSAIMSSSLALFAVFVLNWFAPTMGLGAAFVSLFLLGAVMQLMATWMPYRGKTKVLHNQFAYTAAGIMPILLAFMIFGPHISETARAVIICLLAIMVIFIALFRSIQRAMHRYLYFQVAYLASFHLAFLAATYFSR